MMAIESVLNTIDGMCNSKRRNVKVYEERGGNKKGEVGGGKEGDGRKEDGRKGERETHLRK